MRIAHITSTFFPTIGGAEIVVHQLATHQAEAGHEVFVVAPYASCKMSPNDDRTYRILPLPRGSRWIFNKGWKCGLNLSSYIHQRLSRLQKKHAFDCWHIHFAFPTGYWLLPWLKKNSIPHVLTCHGKDIHLNQTLGYGDRLTPKTDLAIRQCLPQFNQVTALSSSMEQELLRLGVPKKNITSVPNGLDYHRFPSKEEKAKAKVLLKLPKNTPTFLSVGRNDPVKGLVLIPKIIRALNMRGHKVSWILAGANTFLIKEQTEDPMIREQLITYSPDTLSKSVKTGPSQNLPPDRLISLYQAADIFISLSYMESFGMAILEAMAAGLPIVSGNVPGCQDLIQHEINGLLVNPGDADSYSDHILTLLEHPNQRGKMGVKGQIQAKKYDWGKIAKDYLDLYRQEVSKQVS